MLDHRWDVSPALRQHIASHLGSLVTETVKRITHQPFPGLLFLKEEPESPAYYALYHMLLTAGVGHIQATSRPEVPDGVDPYVTLSPLAVFDADTVPTIRVRGEDWPTVNMPLYCDAESFPNAIVYPMFDWTRQQVMTYLRTFFPLADRGPWVVLQAKF